MTKDFGPVSGYLEPDHHSWEQVTWRTGRPPLDKEFNLFGELFLQRHLRGTELCSGFLFSRDYFSPEIFPKAHAGAYLTEPGNFRNETPTTAPASDVLWFGPGQFANVTDMLVYLGQKNDDWLPINLNAAPVGAGVLRFDLVFIEVWRALLTANPAADTANGIRDANGKIFYNGWADSPTADNFVDDILDAGAGQETSRRVQIQWRIRVVDDVDLLTYPDGIDDTTVVFAQGPEAAPTAFTYTSAASVGDPGLWISTGPHSKTVDENVYAIPLCAVARRNQTAWDMQTNANGGTGARPDGYTYDIIEEGDVIDLRKTVSAEWDYKALLERNLSWLFDGKLITDWDNHGLGGGERATWWKQSDEIGPVDTPGATKIAEFDGYRYHFSDAPNEDICWDPEITLGERTVFTDPNVWTAGDQFQVQIPVASDGLISSIIQVATYTGYAPSFYTCTGINTQTVTFTLTPAWEAAIPLPDRTNTSLFVQFTASYPGGKGLSRDPRLYEWTLTAGADPTTVEAGDDENFESVPAANFTGFSSNNMLKRAARDVTQWGTFEYVDFIISSRTTTTTVLPYLVDTVVGIYDNIADPGKTTNLYVSHTGNVITHNAVPATHRQMIIDFVSEEPFDPPDQVSLFYKTTGQQTLDVTPGGINVSDVKLHIVYAPPSLFAITKGSGNVYDGYPYISPQAQIPINATHPTVNGDEDLNYQQVAQVDDFGTGGGFMQLPVNVPLAIVPYIDFDTPLKDGEGRSHYIDIQSTPYDDWDGSGTTPYYPTVFAKLMQVQHPHKVVYPMVGMCLEDSNIGKRGSLVMVLLTSTNTDDQNSAVIVPAPNQLSCVGVYRFKGNPIASPRKYQLGLDLI